MNRIALLAFLVGAALAAFASGASAQVTQLWISSTGTATTVCARTAPCGSFQTAHDAVAGAVQINCVDSGDYGTLTINKSVTVDCSDVTANAASIIVNGTSTTNVRLRGLKLNGGDTASTGINSSGGANLYVENCVISNFTTQGIRFAAVAAYASRLSVTDSFIKNNLGNTSTAGVNISGGLGGLTTRVIVERSQITGNGNGILASGPLSTNGIVAIVITDSVISNSATDGVSALQGGGSPRVSITLDRTVIAANANRGVFASGSDVYVVLNGSTVIANGTGLAPNVGGTILSYRNNALLGNFTDGAPTAFTALN